MFQVLSAIAVVILAVLLLPFAVGATRRSARGRGGDGLGSALIQAETFCRPSSEHVIEAKQAPVERMAETDQDRP